MAERYFRKALQKASRVSFTRLAIDSLGVFCACTLFLEHFYTVQLSEGVSMYPTLSVRGDHLLISRRHNYGNGVQVGDLVRFSHPSFAGAYAAKRVLGLPGDFVCKDKEYSGVPGATGEMVQVPDGHVYLTGDNLLLSRDSRTFGPVPLALISGKVAAVAWPPMKMKWLTNPLRPARLPDDIKSIN